MRLSRLGLALAVGSIALALQTVIPCGDDGNTISTCTVTATDQVVTLSKTVSTSSATITQSLAARRVERIVVPAYSEKYCLAQFKDLGPIAIPDWDGSGLCGSRCDPPENDQYIQTVRVVQCTQNARQSTKVCNEHRETWSRTAAGKAVPITTRCSTRYTASSAGQYTFVFTGTAPRTYTLGPAPTTTTTLRNGRVTVIVGRPQTIWYEPAPYTIQVTKYVNKPTIVNFQTKITTVISIYLPITTITATQTVTFVNTTSVAPSTTSISTTSSRLMTATTATTRGPTATIAPSNFYLINQDPSSGQRLYVKFVNNQAQLVPQQDGAETFNITYGFLQSAQPGNGFGFNGGSLVGTTGNTGTFPIYRFDGFPSGASQWRISQDPNNAGGSPEFLVDPVFLDGANGLCVDANNNLYAVFSNGPNNCIRNVELSAVQRVSGTISTTSAFTASRTYVTVTTIYRGPGTLSPTPFTSIITSGSGAGTVQILYNPSTNTNTITYSGNTTRSSIVAEQTGATPGTINVLVPSAIYVTVTSVYRGTATITPVPFTTTVAQPNGAVPGTVQILFLPSTITNTMTDSGSGTRTSTVAEQSGSTPGTVKVFVPTPTATATISTYFVTVSTIYRGQGTLSPSPSVTTVAQPTGSTPGTVQVFFAPSTITTTTLDSGNSTRTSTINEQSGPTPGTIDVLLPSYVYITTTSGSTSTTSIISPPTGTVQGTALVLIPAPTATSSAGYVFVTNVYRGAGVLSPQPFTSTLAQPSGATPGTIEILYAPSTITTTTLQGTISSTSVVAEQTGPTPGTVGVFLPAYTIIVTVYRGNGTLNFDPSTTTLAQPTGTTSGTVEIFYNPSTITSTTLSGDATSISTVSQQTGSMPGLVSVFLPAYKTISSIYRGNNTLSSAPIASTIVQPTGTISGTVQILYNPSTVTTTTLSGNVTSTSTITEQTGPTAGTVEIILPAYITTKTVYRGKGTLNPEPSSSTVNDPTGTVPGTIQVLFSPTTVTITTLSGTATSTSTIAEQTDSTPGTVEIFLPAYTTVTVIYRGNGTVRPEPSTSTVNQPTGTSSGTVDVFYNPNTITRISVDPTASVSRTTTIAEQIGPNPGTVDIFITGSYITSTVVYRGSGTISPDPSLSTVATPVGTTPGTIDVFYNPNTITVTTTNVDGTSVQTSTVEQVGAIPGTIQIIQTPIYLTTTMVYRGTGTIAPNPSVTTIMRPSGSAPGTVDFLYNPSTITVTTTDNNGTRLRTSIIAEQTGLTPGTVQIIEPASYVTTTSIYRGNGTITPEPSTTTIVQPSDTVPGTVEVLYNPTTITITTLENNRTSPFTTTILEQTGSVAGTVSIFLPNSYVTSTTVYRGSDTINPAPSTTTVATPDVTPGTVSVFYNPVTITVTSLAGNATGTMTSTITEQSGPSAGTVAVIVPDYVTSTTTSGAVSATSTLNQPTGTVPGTVLVIIPVAITTTTRSAVYITVTTVYRGTGTLNPDPSTVTAITASDTITGTVSVFYNPNTITSTSLATYNTTRITTLNQQNGATAGTVQVLLPDYVTTTVTSGSITSTTTLNTPSGTVQGTVRVIVPTPIAYVYVTTTFIYRGAGTITPDPSTSTRVTATGTVTTGTIDIYYNTRTITITTLDNGNSTRTSTLVSQTGPTSGTVQILLPSYRTNTTTSGTLGSTLTLTTASGTVQGSQLVVIPTPITTCGNRGLQYAIYSNPYERGLAAADPTYSAFTARAFQTAQPTATGLVNYLQVPFIDRNTANPQIYGNTIPRNGADQTVVNHRGYLFAKISGTYAFQFETADDIALLWVGSNAYGPTYARSNANIQQLYNGAAASYDQQKYTYTLNMTQGQYMPIRIMWANAGYDAAFLLQIYAPDGELITNGTNSNSPYLVQFSCDGTTAPKYKTWGAET